MYAYFLRRLLLMIPTLLGITMVVFLISWTVPGGPIEQEISRLQFSAQQNTSFSSADKVQLITTEQIEYLKKFYGFDKPIYIAYWDWLKRALVFDFGDSYRYQEPVSSLIVERLPISIYFGLVTTIITYLVCIPLGVFKALFHGNWFDNISSVIVLFGYAIPSFIFGLMLIYTLGDMGWPISGFTSENFAELSAWGKIKDIIAHTAMPIACYLLGSFAYLTLLVKNSFLENMGSGYVKSAVARGLTRYQVFFHHTLRNSLIPVAATFGQNISLVFTGSFLIEKIFNIDGLGLLGFQSVTERDYPVVLGTLFISTLLFLIGNILSDICLVIADARIRFSD